MKIILKETIESLGIIGSEAEVKKGYARNYLLPQGKAVLATPQNRKLMEKERTKFELQIAKETAHAEEMAKRIEGVTCTLKGKVSDENRLYGSITVRDIMTALAAQGIEVEKNMILLNDPIKTLGTYTIPIRVYKGVKPQITVEITAE
ncbi:MAG: 50S ribosomal protein L9 [Desulfobacteraceae bacterium IS3]|nr:MAG: 50S ribosomal protein L9 [Desulfobacteraceae bacterium IS3]HAO20256.1 50S ribosomal protein L9 [Desulfobacteraceae bacterium]